MSYNIKWFLKESDILREPQIVDDFFSLYVDKCNFPDENEREEPSIIRQRIIDNSSNPHTALLAYIEKDKVKGGAMLEYYPMSECCLLTYIFVDKSERGNGIAKRILELDKEKGIPGLIKHYRDSGKKIKAVFFESNNPFETMESNDSMDPAKRLKVFYKLDAKRVEINYIQPPLDENKEAVSNLYLCCFPKLAGEIFLLEAKVLLAFLIEFYHSLDSLNSDFEDQFKKAIELDPNTKVKFDNPYIDSMYNNLLSDGYFKYGFTYLKQLPLNLTFGIKLLLKAKPAQDTGFFVLIFQHRSFFGRLENWFLPIIAGVQRIVHRKR